MIDQIEEYLTELDKRADDASRRTHGRPFARVLRVVVSEVRLTLGLKEPK